MRLLFLLTQSLESPGGSGRFMPLAEALVREGHEVTLVALHHDYRHLQERRFVRNGVQVQYVAQMHVLKRSNLKQYYHPVKLLWIVFVATLRLTWAALTVPSDAIHVCKTQPMNGLAAWIAHRVRGIPVYLDSDDYESVNNRFGSPWQQRVVAWFERWMPAFAAGITVNTRFIRDRFVETGYPPEKIVLVPNGVDRRRFSVLNSPQAEARIGVLRHQTGVGRADLTAVYVGSLSLVSHAVDLLLDAFVLVVATLPEARLVLVGGGEDWERLQKMAQDAGIGRNVVFVGKVPPDEVPFWYRVGAVSVDPRRNTVEVQSSLSLKLVESLAAGVPCISADIGDMPLIAAGAALFVPPDDVSALASALVDLFTDGVLRDRLLDAVEICRNNHWWDGRIAQFVQVYEKR